jgi:metal-responsive CopG/Arc/MetJ family transcriptional regulator
MGDRRNSISFKAEKKLVRKIDDWQSKNGIGSRSAAIGTALERFFTDEPGEGADAKRLATLLAASGAVTRSKNSFGGIRRGD